MNDKQKLAVLIEALQQIRNGKRGVDSKTARDALNRIEDDCFDKKDGK